MEKLFEVSKNFVADYGLMVLYALAILFIGRIIAGFARRMVRHILAKSNIEVTIATFVGSATYYAVLTFAVMAALAKLGIETTSIVAVLGAAGFAVGFAMRDSLSNFAAGLLVLFFRYYKIGDYIQAAGVAGTVQKIGLFSTVLNTPDNVSITVPSGKIFGDVITNDSQNASRRIDLEIGIGYESSINEAMTTLRGIMKSDSRILSEPAPTVAVSELADSSVVLVVRPWVNKDDYWTVRFDLIRKVKEEFTAKGIEIPYPQQVVHLLSEK